MPEMHKKGVTYFAGRMVLACLKLYGGAWLLRNGGGVGYKWLYHLVSF
jgi:hypothetical protein